MVPFQSSRLNTNLRTQRISFQYRWNVLYILDNNDVSFCSLEYLAVGEAVKLHDAHHFPCMLRTIHPYGPLLCTEFGLVHVFVRGCLRSVQPLGTFPIAVLMVVLGLHRHPQRLRLPFISSRSGLMLLILQSVHRKIFSHILPASAVR